MNLKDEISKNIQLVFDNEKSFIAFFIKSDYVEIHCLYMGSDNHFLQHSSEFSTSEDKYICAKKFEEWKESLKQDNKQ